MSSSDGEFHKINAEKCLTCRTYDCEDACFRGVYKVINKEFAPQCTVVKEKESFCVKCHLCTTDCKYGAIDIL